MGQLRPTLRSWGRGVRCSVEHRKEGLLEHWQEYLGWQLCQLVSIRVARRISRRLPVIGYDACVATPNNLFVHEKSQSVSVLRHDFTSSRESAIHLHQLLPALRAGPARKTPSGVPVDSLPSSSAR